MPTHDNLHKEGSLEMKKVQLSKIKQAYLIMYLSYGDCSWLVGNHSQEIFNR